MFELQAKLTCRSSSTACHAGGKAWMVPALARGAVAAGADGLLVEMHPRPCEAWCDADQALSPDELAALMDELHGIARVLRHSL